MRNTATAAAPALSSRTVRRRPAAKNSRDLLLRIAAKLFREAGYSGTSIRDIAKRARIEPSALYYHFPSKEALLEAVLDESILSVMAMVSKALDDLSENATARERIRVAIATHIRAITTHGDYALASRRVMGQIPTAVRRKHVAMRADYGAYWQRLLEDAAAEEPFRAKRNLGLARMFLLGALNWTTEWFDPMKKSPEELAGVLCAILLDGLAVPHLKSEAKRKATR